VGTVVQQQPLQLGFIGGALHSAVGYAHFAASMMDNQWNLAAGCFSRDPQRNRQASQAYGVALERTYKHWEEMMNAERGKLDAIAILTPTPLHYEMVTSCLKSGIPVICEKALCTNLAESKEIQALCSEKKGFLAVTYNYSGYPIIRELRQMIKNGTLGQIIHFQAEMPQEGFIRTDAHGNKPVPQAWRLVDGQVPTIHLDLAVHLHQLIFYLTGQIPEMVISDQSSFGWFRNIVDNVTCLCRYSNDLQGQIWFSKSAIGHRNGLRLRIYGSAASAEWYQASPEELLVSFSDGRRQIVDRAASVQEAGKPRYTRFKAGHPAGYVEAFANLYVDIADCLRKFKSQGKWDSDEVFNADLAVNGFQFLEAMVRSNKLHRWEPVERGPESILKDATTADLVLKFVLNKIEKNGRIPAGTDINAFNYIDTGYIDSIGLIKFIAEIETEFCIDISESDISSQTFKTIGGLISVIEKKLPKADKKK
jgi:predicted dehydrogenase/acyl carrier protein